MNTTCNLLKSLMNLIVHSWLFIHDLIQLYIYYIGNYVPHVPYVFMQVLLDADSIRAPFIIRKNRVFNFARDHF